MEHVQFHIDHDKNVQNVDGLQDTDTSFSPLPKVCHHLDAPATLSVYPLVESTAILPARSFYLSESSDECRDSRHYLGGTISDSAFDFPSHQSGSFGMDGIHVSPIASYTAPDCEHSVEEENPEDKNQMFYSTSSRQLSFVNESSFHFENKVEDGLEMLNICEFFLYIPFSFIF